MKTKFLKQLVLALSISSSAFAQTQGDALGLPGDNFDLYAALDLFKESKNAETFEKTLNSQDTKINNLDLNGDGKVDYIKVVDRSTGDTKVLILQAIISENESQDIAVIELEKRGKDIANLQIVGDEALYGKDYIIEPQDESENTRSNQKHAVRKTNVYINVWGWPGVSWVYNPGYSIWVSPYYWSAYPVWWSPWSSMGWELYSPRVWGYHHPYYHRSYAYHMRNAHKIYYGHRTTSSTVINRNKTIINTEHPRNAKEQTQRGRKENSATKKEGKRNPQKEIKRDAQPRDNQNKQNENNGGRKQERQKVNQPRGGGANSGNRSAQHGSQNGGKNTGRKGR